MDVVSAAVGAPRETSTNPMDPENNAADEQVGCALYVSVRPSEEGVGGYVRKECLMCTGFCHPECFPSHRFSGGRVCAGGTGEG